MFLAWWRHGDSPRGFTLTPSPYFIDILIQLPIALLAPDFERFSYALACTYAVLISTSLYLVLRAALHAATVPAIVATALVMVSFYRLAPFNFVVHPFVVNHTSEVFTTLGLLALVHFWFRPAAPRRRYAPYIYPLLVAGCVASSPFFIATFCIPAGIAAVAILNTEHLDRRRLAWFLGLTAIGALAGLVSIAIISRYVWPVRGDYYGGWWKSYLAFKHALFREPGAVFIGWATALAFIASSALVIVGRARKWPRATTFMLAFFPASVLSCVVLPIKRGAFDGPYAFRYITLPWLLMLAFYAGVLARASLVLWAATLPRLKSLGRPRWLWWTTGVLGACGFVLIFTCHGSMTMDEEASLSSPLIRCFRDAEQRSGIKDGLATWALGRYLNAARYAPDWDSSHVVVQIRPSYPPSVDAWDNNLLWFRDGFRDGKGTINFVVTNMLDDKTLAYFRERIGAPDRTVVCPVPRNLAVGGKTTTELWIWDGVEQQRRLSELVLRDNLRSPFSPIIGATSMRIDVEWGMRSDVAGGELVDGKRVWRRGAGHGDEAVLRMNAMWVPSGRYRLDLDLTVVGGGGADSIAAVTVNQDHHGEIARTPVRAGQSSVSLEFEVDNRGGATSGDAIEALVFAGTADTIQVSGGTLILLEQRGVSPFRIFR